MHSSEHTAVCLLVRAILPLPVKTGLGSKTDGCPTYQIVPKERAGHFVVTFHRYIETYKRDRSVLRPSYRFLGSTFD